MLRTLIVDDEELPRQLLREYLGALPDVELVGECANGFEALKAIGELKPDLVFLDVQMPKLDGFEVVELLDTPPAIIFATAHDQFALRAFEARALDYLLKPFSEERLHKAVQRVRETRQARAAALDEKAAREAGGAARETAQEATQEANAPATVPAAAALSTPAELNAAAHGPDRPFHRLVVKDGAKVAIIPVDQLVCAEAQDDYVCLHTAGKAYLKKQTLSSLESGLDPERFIRVHRGWMINIAVLARLEPYSKDGFVAVLNDGRQVPVSRSGHARLKALLGEL